MKAPYNSTYEVGFYARSPCTPNGNFQSFWLYFW